MITGSALPRLLSCPSSAVLPKAENASEWAEAGHEEHAELAHQVLTGTLPDELARYMPPSPRVEVKLCYNTATGEARILGEAADRNYGSADPFDIFMSLDVLGIDGDTVVVVDFKTGQSDVDPAASNAQLWCGALAACRALGCHRAIIRIVYTNQRGRLDEHEIDALELADFANRLEQLHVIVAERKATVARGEVPPTREGSWCKYCPAKPFCPAKNALVVAVATQGLAVLGDSAMTPERARAGYEQLVRVEDLIRDARKRLENYVDECGPIDLGGGKMFGRYIRNGNEKLSGDVAVKAIAEVIGESAREFEAIAVERKTTKAAIERACKALNMPRGTAPKVIKRIRTLGGASYHDDTIPLGEYVRDRDEPAERETIDADEVNRLLEEAG